MSLIIGMHQAKTQFSKLIKKILLGEEEIIISKSGKPVAKIVPFQEEKKRVSGKYSGQIQISDDFDDDLTEEDLGIY